MPRIRYLPMRRCEPVAVTARLPFAETRGRTSASWAPEQSQERKGGSILARGIVIGFVIAIIVVVFLLVQCAQAIF
ncbi:hypothetical protein BH20CHL6_BH20CHL6_07030 [soil metagenome]|jgi:hypothetical protein